MRLQDKVAVITGGGSGFGEGIARRFAEEGAKVIVADIDAAGGRRVAEEIAAKGGTAAFEEADVASTNGAKSMIQAALERFHGLDILVNNAGWSHVNKPLLQVSEEEFDRCFAINMKAIYLSALEAVPVFRQQGRGGVILNTTSTAGLRPRPGLTWYNATKGAANIATKSMAVELAPDSIRVNAIAPVIGETGLLETFMGMPDTPENREKFLATIPLERFSRPLDIAQAALWLASDEAEFITGVILEVDGGRCV